MSGRSSCEILVTSFWNVWKSSTLQILDLTKKKKSEILTEKRNQKYIPLTAEGSRPQLNIFDKKHYVHFSKSVKGSPQLIFPTPSKLPTCYSVLPAHHLPFLFVLNVILTKSCIASIVPASTLCLQREHFNIPT